MFVLYFFVLKGPLYLGNDEKKMFACISIFLCIFVPSSRFCALYLFKSSLLTAWVPFWIVTCTLTVLDGLKVVIQFGLSVCIELCSLTIFELCNFDFCAFIFSK